MNQDYGRWERMHLPNPVAPARYRCNWFFQKEEEGPDAPWQCWELQWEPQNPLWCLYFSLDQNKYLFACMSPYHPFFLNGGPQFYPINQGTIDQNNPIQFPSINNNPNNKPATPPDPPTLPGFRPITQPDNPGQGGPTSSSQTLTISGLLFKIFLTHAQIQQIQASSSVAADLIPQPEVSAAILVAIGYIAGVDALGGNNGVDISGVIGTSAIMVTPHNSVDIFKVIQIVNNVAKEVANQTNTAITQAFTDIQSGITSAISQAQNVPGDIHHFFNNIGVSI